MMPDIMDWPFWLKDDGTIECMLVTARTEDGDRRLTYCGLPILQGSTLGELHDNIEGHARHVHGHEAERP